MPRRELQGGLVLSSGGGIPPGRRLSSRLLAEPAAVRRGGGGVQAGRACRIGSRVRLVSGESVQRMPAHSATGAGRGGSPSATGGESSSGVVGDTWGFDFEWTLRAGAQTIEQHEYMEDTCSTPAWDLVCHGLNTPDVL